MNIADAAKTLNVSQDTIRRRIRQGTIKAEKVSTPQGDRWHVYIGNDSASDMQSAYVTALVERIASLERELEARRLEVQQLHAIIHRKALTDGSRPSWFQRLFKRG